MFLLRSHCDRKLYKVYIYDMYVHMYLWLCLNNIGMPTELQLTLWLLFCNVDCLSITSEVDPHLSSLMNTDDAVWIWNCEHNMQTAKWQNATTLHCQPAMLSYPAGPQLLHYTKDGDTPWPCSTGRKPWICMVKKQLSVMLTSGYVQWVTHCTVSW